MKLFYQLYLQRLARVFAAALLLTGTATAKAQSVAQELTESPNRAAGSFYALPVGKMPKDSPAPEGKKPFYINHYGCSGSYYRETNSLYEEPYADATAEHIVLAVHACLLCHHIAADGIKAHLDRGPHLLKFGSDTLDEWVVLARRLQQAVTLQHILVILADEGIEVGILQAKVSRDDQIGRAHV